MSKVYKATYDIDEEELGNIKMLVWHNNNHDLRGEPKVTITYHSEKRIELSADTESDLITFISSIKHKG